MQVLNASIGQRGRKRGLGESTPTRNWKLTNVNQSLYPCGCQHTSEHFDVPIVFVADRAAPDCLRGNSWGRTITELDGLNEVQEGWHRHWTAQCSGRPCSEIFI